jgi:hypothetical protein
MTDAVRHFANVRQNRGIFAKHWQNRFLRRKHGGLTPGEAARTMAA